MRDSMVFYRSFADALAELPAEEYKEAVQSMLAYALDGKEPDCNGVAKALFIMAKPQIDANNKRYENGKKGGKPKKLTEAQVKEGAQLRNKAPYKEWRKAVLDKCGNKCAVCGSTDGIVAHHIKGVHEYPDGWYEEENGVALCSKCHANVHKENHRLVTDSATGNLAITECKPSSNLEQTTYKPNDNVNANENVNANVNANDNVNENVKGVKGGKRKRFTPPTPEEVMDYAFEKGLSIDAEKFCDYYESNGWKVGRNPMKDWRAAVRNWAKRSEMDRPRSGTRGEMSKEEYLAYWGLDGGEIFDTTGN